MATPLVQPATSQSLVRARRGTSAWFFVAVASVGSLLMAVFAGTHIIFALVGLPLVISLAWSNPVGLISILPIWMVLLGFVRRFTPGGGNATFSGDPVLLIGPVAIIVLMIVALSSGGTGKRSSLARVVLGFNIVAFLEAFNPAQHSLLTGLGGLMFILVPTLAFWLGRRYGTEVVLYRTAWTIAIMALLTALYGLYQQFVGFPSWDQQWIDTKGYTALNLGSGVVRAFGTFSSAQEYAAFLSIGLITWVALLARRTRWPLPFHLVAIAVVAVALFYESERTVIFLSALALGVMAAARLRLRPINVFIVGLASIALLIGAAGALGGKSTSTPGTSASSVLAQHQLQGITDPTGQNSSLSGHIKATRKGISQGLTRPLGEGSGSVNLASTRYAASSTSGASHGTEFDPGNMGIAFGVMGLVLYVLLLWRMNQTAYRLAVRRRDPLSIFVVGMVTATLFQWTNGNLYSVCWLIWFAVGAADSLLASNEATSPAVRSTPAAPSHVWRKPGEARRALSRA